MSQSGNTTYVKSMNGIITYDDGAGTVIEDGAITTDNFSTTNFNATSIKTNDLQSILPADAPNLYTSTTGDITLGGSGQINLGTNRLYTTGNNLLNTTTGATVDLLTTTTNNINIGKNGRINLGDNRFYIISDDLKHNVPANPIELFTTTTANITLGQGGRINLGSNRMYLSGNDLLHTTPATSFNLFNTTTGTITLGASNKINLGTIVSVTGNTIASAASSNTVNLFNNITTGTINLLTGIRTAGALNIASNTDVSNTNTAPVNIGGTNTSATNGQLSRINLNLNGNNIWSNTETLTSFRSAGGINLASWGANSTINIGAEAGTTTTVNIGVGGSGKAINFSGNNVNIGTSSGVIMSYVTPSIDCYSSATLVSLFNSLTTGSIDFVKNLASTATLTIGGAGKIALGNNVYVAGTQSNINYNIGGGGAVRTITTPSNGVFMYVFGANWGDANITCTTFVSAGGSTCRLFNQYIPPGFSYSLFPTGNQTFTISASFPASFNTFTVTYVKLG